MKKTILTICSATILLISCNSADDKTKTDTPTDSIPKMADTKKDEPAPLPVVDSATMMKNWQAFMTPGDVHKMIASWSGTWKADITMWEKPGAPPMKTIGKAVNKMILGGRYQESVNTGMMMGMPFEGHGLLGYNNATKMFENSWVDNMGTGVMKMSGAWNEATKSVTLTGKGVDPGVMVEREYREIFSVQDDKTQMMEMFGFAPDGKEFKMMEIKFTR
jgi:hypothetical protein